jgi:DNA-directed RNA polymerase subunit H (RpoH/RPB5)
MSVVPQLLPLELNAEKRKKEVLTNIIKMLTNRKLLNKDNLLDNIKNLTTQDSDNEIYKIKLDNPEVYYNKSAGNIYYIKILNQKITGISKNSNIGDFIYSLKTAPKLIIASNITNKAYQQLQEEFPNSEVFTEAELMIDLVSHIAVPKHEILSDEETEIFLKDYIAKKREIPKIFLSDPVSKYFNAKVGQIFRIIRPSEVAGQSIYYRMVIKASLSDEKK